ncbi:MAG: hypothetical protein HQK83_13035 [Fibrobacteria bacterium]|nr:hypothetical protein [Fibrobacteria bacterium]
MGPIGMLVVGAFLGALGTEMLNSRNPKLIKKIREKASGFVNSASKKIKKATKSE